MELGSYQMLFKPQTV